jgi:hypothetical protein
VEGSGFAAGALRLFRHIEEVTYVKAKLREVDLVFHIPIPGQARDWRQVIVRIGLLHGKLDVTFSIPGAEDRETLPEAIIDGLQEAVGWARKNVRAKDLVEMDPEEEDKERAL